MGFLKSYNMSLEPGGGLAPGQADKDTTEGNDAMNAIKSGLCQGVLCEEKETLTCDEDEIVGTHSAECCPRCSHLEGFCNQFHDQVCIA